MRRCFVVCVALLLAHLAADARAQDVPPRLSRALQLDRPGGSVLPRRYPRAPLLDRARDASGATLAWERFGTLGDGASVCVVDTGVDARHRDFLDSGGHTRIRWLVDLGAPPRGEQSDLEAHHHAAIWSARAIDDALAAGTPLPGDRHGHGTAIASAAVGDDADLDAPSPGPSAGIAPRASLIVVRALRDGAVGFEDDDVVHAVELCVALADRGDGAPGAARTTVLLSLGGHDGAHDGREPLERALSAIARDGQVIVVAAGNDGDRAIHASGRALPGAPARITVHVPTPRGAEGDEHWVALAIRTDARVSLHAIDGASVTSIDDTLAMTPHRGGYLLVDASAPSDPGGRFVRAVIGGGGAHAALHAGDYQLVVDGDGQPFDAWLIGAELGAPLGAPMLRGAHVLPGESVTIPATSSDLIAVGATLSRERHGELVLDARDDGSATFSARGPSATGAPRPDLLAPGGFVFAALSSDLDPGDTTNLLGGSRPALDRRRAGEDRIAIEGSSVSAAIVAGAHALAHSLAAAEPARDRALLLSTTNASAAWTDTAGAGALRVDRWLDARAADDRLAPADPRTSSLSLTRSLALPRARDVIAVARVLDAEGRPVHGAELVLRSADRELARTTVAHGRAEMPLALDAPAGERVHIEARVDDIVVGASSVEIRVDEGTRGIARPAGGACSATRASRSSALVVLPAALLALLLRRRH